jgi:hypothetical protein
LGLWFPGGVEGRGLLCAASGAGGPVPARLETLRSPSESQLQANDAAHGLGVHLPEGAETA